MRLAELRSDAGEYGEHSINSNPSGESHSAIAQVSALQAELEQERLRHQETQQAYETLERHVGELEAEREHTVGQLQVAEEELLGLQVKYEEMESELTKSAEQLRKAQTVFDRPDEDRAPMFLVDFWVAGWFFH